MVNLSELPFPLPVPLFQCLLWSKAETTANTAEGTWIGGLAQLAGRPTRITGYLVLSSLLWTRLPMALDEAASFDDMGWVARIVRRNMLVFLVFYGGWHVFLYGRPGGKPLLSKLASRKFDRRNYNLQHDAFWATMGMLITSAYEVCLLHLFATGRCPLYLDLWARPVRSVLLVLAIPYWAEFHFYWIHRFLHEAPGFYKWVHYLHHKSRSPGPFSGLSMHPVESALFFSSCLLPLCVLCHPLHVYFILLYARVSPISGHDGYDKPAGGSLVHYLHHHKVTVNYGTPVVPFDQWFGTFDDGSEWRKEQEAEAKKH